jgi:hypothetical protein
MNEPTTIRKSNNKIELLETIDSLKLLGINDSQV